ncbi:MAG TPA: NADPH-dependent FMN reductase, partial [Bacillota bacterium]|nr:NADPH-dependent FMN reductase [Bacillota bacterium]
MNPQKAVLFIGSPKGKSVSEALGAYLLGKLKEKGLSTDKIKIDKLVGSERGQLELFDAVNQADIIIFSCPLYVDSP